MCDEKGHELSNAQPSPSLAELIRQAEQALLANNNAKATALVKQAYGIDRNNPDVLVLVAQVAPGLDQRRNALLRALQVAPNHAKARRLLAALDGQAEVEAAPVPIVAPKPHLPPQQPIQTALPTTPDVVQGRRTISPLLLLIPVAAVVVIGLFIVLSRGNSRPSTPETLVLRFFDALQSQDNGTFESLMSVRARQNTSFGCSSGAMATCIVNYLKLENVQSKTAVVQSVSSTNVRIILRMTGTVDRRQGDYCQPYEVVKSQQGWEVDLFDKLYGCEGLLVTQPTPPSVAQNSTSVPTALPNVTTPPTATIEPTTRALLQTATNVAATRIALIEGPTLTATALAPMFTQTAVAFAPFATQTRIAQEQRDLEAVLGATQTIASVWATGTAQRLAPTQTAQAQSAFTSTLPGQIIYPGRQFMAFDKATGTSRELPIGADNVSVSSGGKQIAYSQQQGSQFLIFIANVDGSNPVEVTQVFRTQIKLSDSRFVNPVWSPDGRQLAFVGFNPVGSSSHLYILMADGTTWKQVTPDKGNVELPYWSPDGKQIVFLKEKKLTLINADGTGERPLNIAGEQPVWSPDGKTIAYTVDNGNIRDLYLVNADGTNARRIDLGSKNSANWPMWSPDGKYLGFGFYEDSARPGAKEQYRVLDIATMKTLVVMPMYDYNAGRVGWGG